MHPVLPACNYYFDLYFRVRNVPNGDNLPLLTDSETGTDYMIEE